MRYILIILMLALTSSAYAAESTISNQAVEKAAEAHQTQTAPKAEDVAKKQEEKTNEFSCKYYTVKLPDDWKVFLPPTDQQGIVRALFGKESQNPTVAMAITPHGGMDVKTIADIFSQQFKASKSPVEKNGQYVFTITNNDLPTQVWVSVQGPLVMMTSITGNIKEGLNFLKNNVSTQDYSGLFPKQ